MTASEAFESSLVDVDFQLSHLSSLKSTTMEYEAVVKGALKLKGTANKEIQKYTSFSNYNMYNENWLWYFPSIYRKSKKKNKDKAQHDVDSKPAESTSSTKVESSHPQHHKQAIFKTKAQLKFEQMKEEQLKKRILDKASKTHKQRVEEFNRHLDSLTEHFDIPKVSWTK